MPFAPGAAIQNALTALVLGIPPVSAAATALQNANPAMEKALFAAAPVRGEASFLAQIAQNPLKAAVPAEIQMSPVAPLGSLLLRLPHAKIRKLVPHAGVWDGSSVPFAMAAAP